MIVKLVALIVILPLCIYNVEKSNYKKAFFYFQVLVLLAQG